MLHLRFYRTQCARQLILAELLVIGGLLKVLRGAAKIFPRA